MRSDVMWTLLVKADPLSIVNEADGSEMNRFVFIEVIFKSYNSIFQLFHPSVFIPFLMSQNPSHVFIPVATIMHRNQYSGPLRLNQNKYVKKRMNRE